MYAPIILALPDIIIGDAEDNPTSGVPDINLFRFSDAFNKELTNFPNNDPVGSEGRYSSWASFYDLVDSPPDSGPPWGNPTEATALATIITIYCSNGMKTQLGSDAIISAIKRSSYLSTFSEGSILYLVSVKKTVLITDPYFSSRLRAPAKLLKSPDFISAFSMKTSQAFITLIIASDPNIPIFPIFPNILKKLYPQYLVFCAAACLVIMGWRFLIENGEREEVKK